jgi:hypothetical protein
VCDKSSVATKKGNKEGITEFAHKERPFFTATRLFLEKINKQNVKNKKSIGKKFFFNLIT